MNKTANSLDKMTEILSYVANVNKEKVTEILVSLTLEEYSQGWGRGYDAGVNQKKKMGDDWA